MRSLHHVRGVSLVPRRPRSGCGVCRHADLPCDDLQPPRTPACRSHSLSLTLSPQFDALPDSITVNQSIASIPDPLTQPAFYGHPSTSEVPWSSRRLYITETVISEGAAMFSACAGALGENILQRSAGIQEGLVRQVNDLQQLLGSGWGFVRCPPVNSLILC